MSVDNLKGFSEAISSVFPKTEIQKCVVHQIRNSIRYISYKDTREFTSKCIMHQHWNRQSLNWMN